MKRFLLPLFLGISSLAFAQANCNSADHDFGDVEYGVYPDTAIGIQSGVLNEPYNEVIFIKVPTDPSVIDPLFALVTLQQVSLVGISYVDSNGNLSPISNLGLSLECNPASCVFAPGQQYCGVISGTPNQVGEFPIVIETEVQGVAFNIPVNSPFDFSGYTFVVTATASVSNKHESEIKVEPATPNPANNSARITLNSSSSESMSVRMVNMVGAQVLKNDIQLKQGENTITLDVNHLQAGIYLYTLETDSFKTTRKLVVQH
jgi:hypothetical protein